VGNFFNIFKKQDKAEKTLRKNALITIKPYYENGMWVFDDESVGLVKEPFVLGVPEIIETALNGKGIIEPEKGFIAIFSSCSFPQYDVELKRQEEDEGGNWYLWTKTGQKGWICPALFCYYDTAPEYLYVKIEQLKTDK